MFKDQKAKIDWLREGDSNSAYFHKAIKSRKVDLVLMWLHVLMGLRLIMIRLTDDHARDMIRVISRQEVKDALFSMGNDKSSGPDGYTAAFFKESWEIIADAFFVAVNKFFINGKLLKELNHTIIDLIPKIRSPSRVTDYRLIS
nr:hypothetical protein [Tanacetum cinerariifolium]